MGTKTGAGEGLNITDDDEGTDGDNADVRTDDDGEGDEGENEDRGDELFPATDKDALKSVAGDDGEGDEGDEGGDGGEGTHTPKTVPYGRLAESVAKLREQEAENERLRAELAAAKGGKPKPGEGGDDKTGEDGGEGDKPIDIDALEAQYLEAVTEGRTKDALELRKEINAEIKRQAKEEAAESTEQTTAANEAKKAFDRAVADVIEDYPLLDTANKEHDKELIDLVVAKRNALIQSGKPAHEALREAAKTVMTKFGHKPAGDDDGDDKGDGKGGKPDPAKARQKQTIARNAAAAGAQPTAAGGKGNRAASVEQTDVANMSEEEFDALPESEKRRLRGD